MNHDGSYSSAVAETLQQQSDHDFASLLLRTTTTTSSTAEEEYSDAVAETLRQQSNYDYSRLLPGTNTTSSAPEEEYASTAEIRADDDDRRLNLVHAMIRFITHEVPRRDASGENYSRHRSSHPNAGPLDREGFYEWYASVGRHYYSPDDRVSTVIDDDNENIIVHDWDDHMDLGE